MKVEKNPPSAKRLIKSLIDLGYDFESAVADLLDNSIEARAGKVTIDLEPSDGDSGAFFYLADDGVGMDKAELKEALRFGSDQTYDKNSLGKYGLGLKTASLSQCRQLTVVSKPKVSTGKRSSINVAAWDMDLVEKEDDWFIRTGALGDIQSSRIFEIANNFYKENKQGTIVIWEDFSKKHPLLEGNDKKRDQYVIEELEAVSSHISWFFHKFLQGITTPKRKRLSVSVGGEEVVPKDPFCLNEKKTDSLQPIIYKVDFEGKEHEVEVAPYIIPKQADFSSQQALESANGPKKMNQSQGFYFYRNGRLLKYGGWERFRAMDEHTKLARVSIDFPKALDDLVGLNITKAKAKIPGQISSDLKAESAKWVSRAKRKYSQAGTSGSNSTNSRGSGGISKGAKNGSSGNQRQGSYRNFDSEICGIRLFVSDERGKKIKFTKTDGHLSEVCLTKRHPLVMELSEGVKMNSQKGNLNVLMFAILEGLADRKLRIGEVPSLKIRKKAKEFM